MVEAQYVVSTMKVVDTLAEQKVLEDILEERKPPIPEEAAGLHYLLYTPFRYETLALHGSRFRAIGDPGVFYGAERVKTAAAEKGYWRWRFLQDSSGLDRLSPAQFTAFSVALSGNMIDVRRSPFSKDAALWTHPSNYGPTQSFGRIVRKAAVSGILYQSVRDPEPHFCCAVLTPKAFASKEPEADMQAWTLTLLPSEAIWQQQGGKTFAFKTVIWGASR